MYALNSAADLKPSKRQSGYNIDLFLNQDSAHKYLCSICHHVVSDCHETLCGHIFCGSCIACAITMDEKNIANVQSSKFKCPFCNVINHQRPRTSTYLNRAVACLRVKCPFHIAGCDWTGALSDLMINKERENKDNKNDKSNGKKNSHLMKCRYAPVLCDECNNRICRKDFENHRKKCLSSCPNCKIKFHAGMDRKTHYLSCPQITQCTYCKKDVLRNAYSNHLSFLCSQRQIKCPFYHFGCHEMIKSANLTAHLKYNSTQHYQLKVDHCIDKIDKLKIQVENLGKQNADFQSKQDILQTQNDNLKKQISQMNTKTINNQSIHNHSSINQSTEKTIQSTKSSETATIENDPAVLFLVGSNKWEETGVFIKRSTLHQGRACYTSFRTKCAIRWNPELSAWLIDRRGLHLDNEASLIAYQDCKHPGLVTANWLVYNDDIQEWIQSENYRIQCFNLAEFIFEADTIFKQQLQNQSPNQSPNQEANNNKENIVKWRDRLPPGLLGANNNSKNK